jgi:hypothetical protein
MNEEPFAREIDDVIREGISGVESPATLVPWRLSGTLATGTDRPGSTGLE